jgi:hypothetical protein
MFNTTHHRTSAPDDYAFGEIDNRVGFYFLWFGLLFFFLLWIWGATRSCCWRLETARVGNTAEDANQELSRKNRKQRLVDHFESGKNKMVRRFDSSALIRSNITLICSFSYFFPLFQSSRSLPVKILKTLATRRTRKHHAEKTCGIVL